MTTQPKERYGPETKCKSCGATMASWRLVHGIKYTIKLERTKDGKYVCQFCDEKKR